ncbi:beta-lactamase/transpeptidase-like protein [Aspergillus keveii]|uniref:Beta-lactamase/transpeptidase-like protein n=1 Tax=Aspergillus keveii TaxID=714993 RepID=A0ABR4FPN8_9EURO
MRDIPTFEEKLAQATALGADKVPGCVVQAVDKTAKIILSRASGYDSVRPGSERIDPSGTFWLASCSKLVGAIAALLCVEAGLVTLDESLSTTHLPELGKLDILNSADDGSGPADGQFTYMRPKNYITLRRLLTHSSGLSYDISPTLAAWRASRGERSLALSGTVIEAQSARLLFEPGEGWMYSGGIDWAGLPVERLHNVSLEIYMQKHICQPLGLTSMTFRLREHPEVAARLVSTNERQDTEEFRPSRMLWPKDPVDDVAGAGLFSTVHDFVEVLGDLLKETPALLKRDTVDQIFTPQLTKESASLKALRQNSDVFVGLTGVKGGGDRVNHGIGAFLYEADAGVVKAGTLIGGGLQNLLWFVNRQQGVAGMMATQILPPGDPVTFELARAFVKAMLE